MPIYEYVCPECDCRTARLVLKPADESRLSCRRCGSGHLKRILSRFAVHQTEASRMRDLDTRRTPDDDFYRDDRNIGLRAKKRMQELGVNLGDSLDEKIEKARTKKLDGILDD